MDDITKILFDFFSGVPRPVVLHEPSFIGNESNYVQDCIETGWVSSVGSYVDKFSKDLELYTGAFAIPVMNGTAALHLSLILAGVQPGDEVFVPDITFVATSNAVHYCHAVPHFVEVEEQSYGIDPEKLSVYLKQLHKIPKFLIITHIFGIPSRIQEIIQICEEYEITVIEDAAESLGSYYGEQHTGTFGTISALSFNGNKIITTGGGGAVLTKNPNLADKAKHLSTTAKTFDPYSHIHDEIGYNYRMPNLNAALGCAQLENLPNFLNAKQHLAAAYKNTFNDIQNIKFVGAKNKNKINNWLNNIVVPSEKDRNELIDKLNVHKIFCRGLWAPMSKLAMNKTCPKMNTPVANDLFCRTVSLPSSASLAQYIK